MPEGTPRAGAAGPAVCTIIAKNYLAYARALVKSVRRHHPGLAFYVLFVDDTAGFVDAAEEDFELLDLGVLDLPRRQEFLFRYDVMELSTAVKPYLLRWLFDRGHDKVLYLDPDLWFFRPLDDLFAWLDDADVLLIPHLTGPLGDGMYPDERDILLSGTYNLGFIGLRRSPQVDQLLAWWADRCEFFCVSDITHGMFVDQRWMDLTPGQVDRVRIIRHPGYNLAYWNLKHRLLAGDPAAPVANGEPVVFYHWSGFDALKPTALSKHQNRYPVIDSEPLLSMAREYSSELLADGYRVSSKWPYSLGVFKDGHPIAREMRDLFREQPPGLFPDPFEPAGPDSFVSWAVTPPPTGGPAPLVERLHRTWTRLDRSPRWRRSLPARILRKVAVKVLDPLREALARRAPLPPLAGKVLDRRPDVQQAFAVPGGGVDRLEFLRWLASDGVAHHRIKPAWCARWLEHTEGTGVMRRLLEFYDTEPELQRRFPLAFVEEHDAPAFLAWLEEHGVARGLPAPALVQIRRVFAAHPTARIREIYKSRPDVMSAYPDALGWASGPGFVSWLHHSGLREHGVAEDWILWFERAQQQHACLRVQAMYRDLPEWQSRHPLGLSPFGRRSLLEWLKGEEGERLGLDLSTVARLCAPAVESPLEDLRLLHAKDPEVARLFPRAFEDAEQMQGLLTRVHRGARELALDPEWLERLGSEIPRLSLSRGATVVGYLRTESGMGELSRSMIRALRAVDYPITTVDIDDAPQRQFDLSVAHEDQGHPLPFTIVHANAPEAVRHAVRLAPWLRGRYAIGYWAWELQDLPENWEEGFAMFREVWTCSIHAAAAISRAAPCPVQAMWPALPDAVPSSLRRQDLGLPEDRFVFLFAYDLLSESDRKNPLGLLAAFRKAFRKDDAVHLVLKVTNGDMRREDLRRLSDAASGLPVTVVERYLSRADVLGLIRLCDAYVSLHRAEGFGYTMAEAMAMEKPVVATYYSGNVDFMTPWNSFTVPYRLVEIPEDRGRYAKGRLWADPDLSAAAELMRGVFTGREHAALVARRGREDVTRMLSARACGERIEARLRTVTRQLPFAWESEPAPPAPAPSPVLAEAET
jgi:glycosyltransferase involved in cell wall biosynthesis